MGRSGKEPSRMTLFLNPSLAGQRAALLDERGRRALRRRSTGQSLNPKNGSIGLPLQRANVNLKTRSGSGLEVQHQPPRAVGPTVQHLLTLLPLLILPAVGAAQTIRKTRSLPSRS